MNFDEKELREIWTQKGIPQDRQDEIIAQIVAKAPPGAMVGPFRIGDEAYNETLIARHKTPDWCPAIGETIYVKEYGAKGRGKAYTVKSYSNLAPSDQKPDWQVYLESMIGKITYRDSIEMLRPAIRRKHLETAALAQRLAKSPIKAKVNQTFDMDGLPLFDDTRHQIDMF